MKKELPEYMLIRGKIRNIYIQIKDGHVIVKAPNFFSKNRIDDLVYKKREWINKKLQQIENKQAKQDLYSKQEFVQIVEQNVKELILLTNLKPNKVRIRKISYAWGSCSTKKNITINENLIKYSKQAIRYVILHELCHLQFMNHSKEFWNLVSTYMPEYKQIKREFI